MNKLIRCNTHVARGGAAAWSFPKSEKEVLLSVVKSLLALWIVGSAVGVAPSDEPAVSTTSRVVESQLKTPAGGRQSTAMVLVDRCHVLDLSKKESYILLDPTIAGRNVAIEQVTVSDCPVPFHLLPKSGQATLRAPLDIQLETPGNVRIRLSLVPRGARWAVRIAPQIVLGPDEAVDLTRHRVTRLTRNLRRRVTDLQQQLAACQSEKQSLDLWLHSPGNKPLSAVKTARFRMKMLDQTIQVYRRDLPAVLKQCAALGRAAAFVEQLHAKMTIRFRVASGRLATPADQPRPP